MATRAQAIEQRINVVLAGWDRVRNAFSQVGNNGERAFRRVEASANRVKPAVDRTHRSVQQLGGGMDRLVGIARRVAFALGAAFGIRELGRTADAFTEMENKLKAATDSTEEFTDVQDKLRQMSNETRTNVTENAQAFVRFDTVMRDLGGTSDETIRLLETLNKSLAINGVSTQEAQAGIRQLSQAFGSGRLSGDEFRSVMENLPPVARALAVEMDAPTGALKQLAADGEITSERLANAIASMGEEADREFAELELTVSSAVVVFRNELGFAINSINKFVGATRTIAGGILLAADNFEIITSAAAGLIPVMIGLFGPVMLAAVKALWAAILRHPFALLVYAITSVITYLIQLRDEFPLVEQALDRIGQILTLANERFLQVATAVRDFVAQMTGGEVSNIASTWQGIAQSINNGLQWIIDNFDAVANGVTTFAAVIGGAAVMSAIASLGQAILILTGYVKALTLASALNPFVLMVAGAVALGVALGTLITWIATTDEGWSAFVTAVQNSTPVRTFEALSAVVERVFSGMVNTFETVSGVVERVFSGIENTFNFLAGVVERVVSGVINVFTNWQTASDNIAAAIRGIWESFANWFAGTWLGKVIGAIKSAISWFKKLIGAKDAASGSAAGGPVGAPAMARGGMVWGAGTATSDSIWGRLSRGEYVLRAAAVAKYGKRFLDMINSLRLPRSFLKGFNVGGFVDSIAPKVPRYAGGGFVRIAQPQTNNMTPLNLTIESLNETFEGLLAPEHTASQIVRYSVGKQNVSTGKKPWWYR